MRNFAMLIFFFVTNIFFQTLYAAHGSVVGYIFDQETNKPIPDANIMIAGINLGTISKDGGFYFITNVPPGSYHIRVSVIGYEPQTKEVTISANTVINFFLAPKAIEFDPVLVTATLFDHLQSQVSVSSEVLTLPHLRTKNAETVGEAIESIGSVYFNSYDGICGTRVASVRGSNADQVVVLLDGLRLNTAQGGGVDLNLLPVAALERIEIIRGGHSSLMGSDAIGGAIQLISKESLKPRGLSLTMNTTVGSFGARHLTAFGAHRIGASSFFLSYNQMRSDGDFAFKMPVTGEKVSRINNDYQGNNFFLKAKYDLSSKHKIHALFHSLQAKKGNAGSVNINPWTNEPMLTPRARSNANRQLFSIGSENQVTHRLRLEGDIYTHWYDYDYKDPDGWLPTADRHENMAKGLRLQGQFSVHRNLNLINGAEIRQDRLQSTKFQVVTRNNQSVYALTEITLPAQFLSAATQLTFIPALRWDHYSDADARVSPKLGLLITQGKERSISLHSNIGQSYRLPTFDDLYWPDEGWGRGNPNLRPESSTNFDIGCSFSRKSNGLFQLEASYFSSIVKDLISWDVDQNGIYMPLNIATADIKGLETGVKIYLPKRVIYLEAFHTWLKAIDNTPDSETQGMRLIYRPDHKLDLLVGGRYRGLAINLNYRWIDRRFTVADNSKSLSSYYLLNGNISYSWPIAGFVFDAKLQVINILDKSLYLIDGYPLPGREIRFSLGMGTHYIY